MTQLHFAPRLRRFSPALNAHLQAEAAEWTPTVDIFEHSDRFVVSADLPGVAPEAIDIEMQDNVLTLSGSREATATGDATLRSERRNGRFLRRFTLPTNVDGDAIEARSEHGNLQIVIPKQQKPEARRIEVSVD